MTNTTTPADNPAGQEPTPTSVFAGETPLSAGAWWTLHPDLAPPVLTGGTVLLDKTGEGPSRFAVPHIADRAKVLMVVTCAEPVPYRLDLGTPRKPVITWTRGDSCGGPDINSYLSPPLPHNAIPAVVRVSVPRGARFAVTVYQIAA